MTSKIAYRAGLCVAFASALFLVWLALGVGINGPDGEPFDRIYIAVLGVAMIGSAIGRFRPVGMARAFFATALAQASAAGVALLAGKHLSGVSPAAEILGVNGIFVLLFLTSAGLFRKSALMGDDTLEKG